MISKKAIAAVLVAATMLTAVPANATGFTFHFGHGAPGWSYGPHHGPSWRHGRVSPREVRSILRRHGYHDIRFADRRGPVYQVRASKHRNAYFLVVSARNGEILSAQRVRHTRW